MEYLNQLTLLIRLLMLYMKLQLYLFRNFRYIPILWINQACLFLDFLLYLDFDYFNFYYNLLLILVLIILKLMIILSSYYFHLFLLLYFIVLFWYVLLLIEFHLFHLGIPSFCLHQMHLLEMLVLLLDLVHL